jgi:CubicO group peptidase (beta-lactamase class C family)
MASNGSQLLQNFGIIQRTPKTLSELVNSYYYNGGDYYSLDNFENTNPGEVENYSNVGASLMAFLIEIVSGMSYQNFIETHILIHWV